MYRANSVIGICEKMRMIYDEIHGMPNNEKATELLVDAFIMAKKMQDRLSYYKKTYNDTTGHNGANLVKGTGTARERLRMRSKREHV